MGDAPERSVARLERLVAERDRPARAEVVRVDRFVVDADECARAANP